MYYAVSENKSLLTPEIRGLLGLRGRFPPEVTNWTTVVCAFRDVFRPRQN